MSGHLWLTVISVVIFTITMDSIVAHPDMNLEKDLNLIKMNDTDFKIDKDIPMGADPRFNKMLPEPSEIPLPKEVKKPFKPSTGTITKTTTTTTAKPDSEKEYPEDYYYYDDSDEEDSEDPFDMTKTHSIEKNRHDDDLDEDEDEKDLKPIDHKDEKKKIFVPTTPAAASKQPTTTPTPTTRATTEAAAAAATTSTTAKPTKTTKPKTEDDEMIFYDEEIEDEEDMLTIKDIQCPQECQCVKNVNNYMIALCSKLHSGQHFGSAITDLEVTNVPPTQTIILGAGFFKSIGLASLSTIKIANCSIEYIHPNAFQGLNELFAVNLTNTGITLLHPDTFAENRKLKLLTLAENDLNQMQQKATPFTEYMLNAPSVEELDLSHCKLQGLLPTAFTHLKNIVYINLADNQLKTLPLGIFAKLESLEELDLSSNNIDTLPKEIFVGTAVSILNMKYNQIQSNVDFVPIDAQKLDLSNNKITNVNNMMFQHLKKLTSLILKGNAIRKIHETAFYPLRELRHIDLSFNDLEQISSLVFLGNVDLDVIRLNDNPRLKKLPLEGFESSLGMFNVYLFDASNCDLNDLGENTFSTMPHLSTLNLSWNNIETIGKGFLSYLNKLIELDLSNNLITNLDELTLLHNSNLKKLSLTGNPLQQLSIKTFLPTKLLTELDLSDCDLRSVWTENSTVAIDEVNLKSLRVLNLANNDIEHIHVRDFEAMKSLIILDLDNNKLQCTDELWDVARALTKKQVRLSNIRHDAMDDMMDTWFVEEVKQDRTWSNFALTICKDQETNIKPNPNVIDTDNDGLDDGDDDDDDEDETDDEDDSEYGTEDRLNKTDDSDTDEDCFDCDDGFDYGNDGKAKKNGHGMTTTSDGLSSDEMQIIKQLENDDEIILERRPFIYYGQYRYLIPILIIVFGVIAILLLIGKLVSIMLRRRGERYRQALLASKNSIVYQKLSEDLYGPATPKINRYAPINQV